MKYDLSLALFHRRPESMLEAQKCISNWEDIRVEHYTAWWRHIIPEVDEHLES